jgi:hypothetical protein
MTKKLSRKRNRNRSGGGASPKAPVAPVAPKAPVAPSNVTFATKLGAYMLESVTKGIEYSSDKGFSDGVPQVFGILPFLHLNISEEDFKKSLENGSSEHSHLRKLCKLKLLDTTLTGVDFNCEDQIKKGFESLNDGLVYSINTKFASRLNGQKRLQEILNYQKIQRTSNNIPKESLEWSNGFDNNSEVKDPVEEKSWWEFWK